MKSNGFFGALVSLMLIILSQAQAQAPAWVEFFSPQGTVKDIRQVSARFSEQMVPFGDPRVVVDPFEIACSERGAQRWVDGKNWVYDFDRNLPAGVRCEFRLSADLKTLAGREITGQQSFAFSTGGPAIRSSTPYQGSEHIDEEQVFILELDAEPTEESVLTNVSFSVEGLVEPVGVKIISGQQREQLLKARFPRGPQPPGPFLFLQARQRFPAEAKVSLVWGKGVASQSGVATDNDQILPFKARGPFTVTFRCRREDPQSGCIPILPMSLNFSAPVAREKALQAILRGPSGRSWKAEVGEQYGDEELIDHVSFKGPFPEKGSFTVEIPKEITDDAGRRLINGDKFPLKVRTEEYPPLAKFAADFGIVEVKPEPVLPVTLRNIEAQVNARMVRTATQGSPVVNGQMLKVPAGSIDAIISWLRRVRVARREHSVFSQQEKQLREFKIPKPNGPKAFEVVGIPLKEPGFYVVEIASEILGASLIGKGSTMFVPTSALVTNLAVHFKWGSESSLAWVTTLDQGKPVPGAQVQVTDCSGQVIWAGGTDSNGIAWMANLPARPELHRCGAQPYSEGLFVFAQLGNDQSFIHTSWDDGIEPWRFQLPHEYVYEPMIAHTIFDRTLLRAGETVSMKHVIRNRVMEGFAHAPDAQRPATAVIEHIGSDQRYELPLKWESSGTAEMTWAIPKDAKLGVYQVRLTRAAANQRQGFGFYSYYNRGDLYSGQFRVEEFRVPIMKATIQPPAGSLVAPAQVPVDLSVRYLAGGGAANQPVKLRSQIARKPVTFLDDHEGFIFANGAVKEGVSQRGADEEFFPFDYDGETAEFPSPEPVPPRSEKPQIQPVELTLDKSGTARATISKLPAIKEPMDLLAELEFKDPNGETQTVSSRIPMWPADRLVGIKPDSWAASKENLKFHVAVVDLGGKPVADAPVNVELLERKVYSHRKRLVGGFYAYENVEEVRNLGALCAGKTDQRGLVICEAKSPVSGNVILQARAADSAGREVAAHSDTWVAGKEQWWFQMGDHDRIDVLPEKKRYEPGESARFQVRMPFKAATALVTVEREGVLEAFVREISGNEPVVEIPIKGHYAPNVFVSVLALRGRVTDVQPTATVDLGRPAYKLGIAEINVKWHAHELKVHVLPERTVYKVRDKALVKIIARRADGTAPPAGSEAAVAAVDEGLLELMQNKSWDVLTAMMGRRSYNVTTATAQMHVIGKRHFGLKAVAQGGGGGKMVTRELFDTLLLWKARVPLDANGEATLEVPLNDAITSFRIVAVVTGGAGHFGSGFGTIRSMQELMLFSGIAPLAREGDSFKSEFTVRNASEKAMKVQVSAQIQGLPRSPSPVNVALAPGEAKEIGWDIKAPFGANALTYEVEAKENGGTSDSLRVSQKVVSAVPVRTYQATVTQVGKDFRVSVERPRDAVPGRGGVNVLFRPKISEGLAGVVDYMKRYPYTCMEQRVSQAVALRDENLWRSTMALLPSHLDSSGLVKFFPTMVQGSEVLTSYLLAIADEAGWEVPAASKNRMESALVQFIEGKIVRYSALPTADLALRKMAAIEALSRSGRAEAALLGSIAIESNLWPTSGVIDWFNVLQRVKGVPNREQRLKEAEQILRSRLNLQGTAMNFSTERTDYLWWLMVTTDTNALKLVLALVNAEPWKQDMPRLVQGALFRQRKGTWDSTLANAWGVLALEKFSRAFESIPVSGQSLAKLSGKTQSVDWQQSEKGKTVTFSWPSGKDDIAVKHSGAGKPWVTVQSLAAIPLKQPLSSGYKIKKSWTALDQKQPGRWSRGDLVRVSLELEAQTDMTWVVVNDPIPAGAAILGSGLGRDSQLATQGQKQKGWAWPAFQERSFEALRTYYEYVPKGNWTVEYTIRLNQAGTFQLPTTRVEALYAAELFGEMPNGSVRVYP